MTGEWYPSNWSPGVAGGYEPAPDAVPIRFVNGPLHGREGHSRDALSALWVVATPDALVVRSAVEQPTDLPPRWKLLGRYVLHTASRSMVWHGLEVVTPRWGFRRITRRLLPPTQPTVRLRGFLSSDDAMLAALNARPEVSERFGSPVRAEDAERWSVQVVEADGQPVGIAGLLPSHIERGCSELVCALTLEGEGRGIATAASRLLIAGMQPGTRLLASIATGNVRAERLAFLLGFRHVRPRPISVLSREQEQVYELHPPSSWWGRLRGALRDAVRKLGRVR